MNGRKIYIRSELRARSSYPAVILDYIFYKVKKRAFVLTVDVLSLMDCGGGAVGQSVVQYSHISYMLPKWAYNSKFDKISKFVYFVGI